MSERKSMFKPTQEDLTALEGRIKIFTAVAEGSHTQLDEAEAFYKANQDHLLPKSGSVDSWAARTGQSVSQTRREHILGIFKRDIAIAEKHQKGEIARNGTIFTLADLIKQEEAEAEEIRAGLKEREQL